MSARISRSRRRALRRLGSGTLVGAAWLVAAAGAQAAEPPAPCPRIIAGAHPDLGSGACTGNYATTIAIPGIGALVHNSLAPTVAEGFGNGFRFNGERRIYLGADGVYRLQLGNGTETPLTKTSENRGAATYMAVDQRLLHGTFVVDRMSPPTFREYPLAGGVVTYTPFGAQWLWTAAEDAHHSVTTVARAPGTGRLASLTDVYGQKVTFTSTGGGNVQSIKSPSGATTTLGYDASGNLATVRTPDGTAWTLEYDASRVVKIHFPSGNTRQITYFPQSNVVQTTTDEHGRATSYAYDAATLTMADGLQTYVERFSGGRLVSQTVDGIGTTFELDAQGRVARAGSFGAWTTMTYLGATYLPATITGPDGAVVSYQYTSDLQDVAVMQATANGVTKTKTTTWTALHKPLTVTVDGQTTTYAYNDVGDLLSVTNPFQGKIFAATYDAFGRPQTVTDRASLTTTYAYTGAYLTQTVDPLGRRTTYTVDADGNLASAASPDGLKVSRTYSSVGEILSESIERATAPTYRLAETLTTAISASGALLSASSTASVNGVTIGGDAVAYEGDAGPGRFERRTFMGLDGTSYQTGAKVGGSFQSVPQTVIVPALDSPEPSL